MLPQFGQAIAVPSASRLGKYQRYNCQGCGAWPHGRTNLITKEARGLLIGNVA